MPFISRPVPMVRPTAYSARSHRYPNNFVEAGAWQPASLLVSPRTGSNREDQGHEICAEWDDYCCRPGYCGASLGANRSAKDAIAQRAISDIGADGIDRV